nr:Zn-ribbon domain-containing OB-fold protein [Gemmobacter sp.]
MAHRNMIEPEPTEDSAPFWAAANEGRFLLRVCADCGVAHWYPRSHCPFCSSRNVEWREASGKGTIYSYTLMRKAKPPYVLTYVTLDEGPKMLVNIVDSDFDAITIGARVHATFGEKTASGRTVPMFTLTTAEDRA